MVNKHKSTKEPPGGDGLFSSSAIGQAVRESTGFHEFMRLEKSSEEHHALTEQLVSVWYVLKKDGSSISGILDAAKDVVHREPEINVMPNVGLRPYELSNSYGGRPFVPQTVEVDITEESAEQVSHFFRGIQTRFAIIYTLNGELDDELVEVGDSEIAYIEVSHEVEQSLFKRYSTLIEMTRKASRNIRAAQERLSKHFLPEMAFAPNNILKF